MSDTNFTDIERLIVSGDATLDMSGVSTNLPQTIKSASTVGHAATIIGTQGNDRITGSGGDDVIAGATGNDTIFAGSGHETFNELMAGFGRDLIYNANLSTDTFNISGLASDASHLFFTAINRGVDTQITGMNPSSQPGDALILKSVSLAAAQGTHFTFGAPAQI